MQDVSIITLVRGEGDGWQWWFSDANGVRIIQQTDEVDLPTAFEQMIESLQPVRKMTKMIAEARPSKGRRRKP